METTRYKGAQEEILELLLRIEGSRSAKELGDLVLGFLRRHRFGVEYLIPGMIPRADEAGWRQRAHYATDHWPQAWIARYLARNYFRLDPVVRRVMAAPEAFRWSEIDLRGDPDARRMMDDAAAHGLVDGFTVPFRADGHAANVSFAGQALRVEGEGRQILYVVAAGMMTRFVRLRGWGPVRPSLSARELAALQLLADGLQEIDISERMKISESTVEKHLQHAKRKLRTVSRPHAVAVALRRRLIF